MDYLRWMIVVSLSCAGPACKDSDGEASSDADGSEATTEPSTSESMTSTVTGDPDTGSSETTSSSTSGSSESGSTTGGIACPAPAGVLGGFVVTPGSFPLVETVDGEVSSDTLDAECVVQSVNGPEVTQATLSCTDGNGMAHDVALEISVEAGKGIAVSQAQVVRLLYIVESDTFAASEYDTSYYFSLRSSPAGELLAGGFRGSFPAPFVVVDPMHQQYLDPLMVTLLASICDGAKDDYGCVPEAPAALRFESADDGSADINHDDEDVLGPFELIVERAIRTYPPDQNGDDCFRTHLTDLMTALVLSPG